MSRWEVAFPIIGNFEFEGNFEIAEVTFSKNVARKEWEAKTIIEAENRGKAIKEAKEKIENKLDVIAFVRETGLEMGYPSVYQLDSKEIVQFTKDWSTPIIDKTHQRIIKRVYENLEPCFRDSLEEIEKTILALRWYRKGCFFDNPSDRFLAFWIALECLVGGEEEVEQEQLTEIIKKCKYFIRKTVRDNDLGSKLIQRFEGINKLSITETMIKNIKNILPNVDAGLEKKIRDLQKERSNIVHRGVFHIDKIEKHNNYLKERLLGRLLKEKLGMAFNNFINSWPTPKLRESLRDDHLKIEPIKQVLLKYPEGATIEEIEYGLYALTKRIRRSGDLHIKLEKLIEMGDIRNQIVNNEKNFFLNA
jgi:hypothetical protein